MTDDDPNPVHAAERQEHRSAIAQMDEVEWGFFEDQEGHW